uniref:Uncharacterized protein n=1 Tax=Knipowitschia caucasica TaxID=637954 RepID=A0AAV2JMC4_KNICA
MCGLGQVVVRMGIGVCVRVWSKWCGEWVGGNGVGVGGWWWWGLKGGGGERVGGERVVRVVVGRLVGRGWRGGGRGCGRVCGLSLWFGVCGLMGGWLSVWWLMRVWLELGVVGGGERWVEGWGGGWG